MHKCPKCGSMIDCLTVEGVMMTGKTSIKVDPNTGMIDAVAPIVPTVTVKKGFSVDQLSPDKIKASCNKCGHRDAVKNFGIVRICYFTGNEATKSISIKLQGTDINMFVSDEVDVAKLILPRFNADTPELNRIINAL